MKEFDKVFKDIDQIFKATEKIFEKTNSDMDRVFKDMDRVFKEVDKQMSNVYRKQEAGPWKEWFAWRPVKLHGKRVWFKKVYRRKINTYVDHDNWARYEYGNVFDVLKDAAK